MEKYKSDIIKECELHISVDSVNVITGDQEKKHHNVLVTHIPTGWWESFSHPSQMIAYNYCLLTLESKLRMIDVKYKPIYKQNSIIREIVGWDKIQE